MRVFMNFNEVRGPYGGTNSFLRTLRNWLRDQPGVKITHDVHGSYNVALLSGMTDGVNLALVKGIAARGIPIVHRKVGYRVSGSPEMRAMVNGVVHGDALQVAFTPFVTHTIFQSAYSRDVFAGSGFDGPFTVIHNGVDETMFNMTVTSGWLLKRRHPRTWWNGSEPLHVVISTWSTDRNKGFEDYAAIDRQLEGQRDVELTLVGRTPANVRFRHIRVLPPQRRAGLARVLKRAHVVLQLAHYETCSNALIEGLNCGLPAIYRDSGSNAEIAGDYGVAYSGDWRAALDTIRGRYREYVDRLPSNPYRISVAGPRYLDVVRQAAQAAHATS